MKKLFGNFEEIVAGFFLIITVSSVVLNVFCRSIGLGTISTSEEIATISFVWSVYIGAVACYKRKMHIGVDMLVQMFSKKGRNIFAIFLDICSLSSVKSVYSNSAIFVSASDSSSSISFSSGVIYLSAPTSVCFLI